MIQPPLLQLKESSGNQSNDAGNNILDEIITTEEEKEGYLIIKSILRENVDLKRIFMRDKKSYCAGCLKTKVNSTIVTKFSTIRSINV